METRLPAPLTAALSHPFSHSLALQTVRSPLNLEKGHKRWQERGGLSFLVNGRAREGCERETEKIVRKLD